MSWTIFTPTLALLGVVLALPSARAEDDGRPKFLGAQSCNSAMCHGGASAKSDQYTIWTKQDAHARSQATLTTARAARLADVLKLGDATQSGRCTSCHAPLTDLNPAQMAGSLRASEGVSCENCHAPAGPWLRSHTRKDYSHADRVQAGVRDLNHLYVRANSCVACHETLDPDVVAAGHPELIFELDGQAVSEPRHWREKGDFQGAQAWLVGQAVALRELSWQLARAKVPNERLTARWQGLVWLLGKLGDVDQTVAAIPAGSPGLKSEDFSQVQHRADAAAKAVSELSWTEKETSDSLARLVATAAEFRDGKLSRQIHARRAERLVLAIDRLVSTLDKSATKPYEPEIQHLFQLAQSLPEFSPEAFGRALEALGKKLK